VPSRWESLAVDVLPVVTASPTRYFWRAGVRGCSLARARDARWCPWPLRTPTPAICRPLAGDRHELAHLGGDLSPCPRRSVGPVSPAAGRRRLRLAAALGDVDGDDACHGRADSRTVRRGFGAGKKNRCRWKTRAFPHEMPSAPAPPGDRPGQCPQARPGTRAGEAGRIEAGSASCGKSGRLGEVVEGALVVACCSVQWGRCRRGGVGVSWARPGWRSRVSMWVIRPCAVTGSRGRRYRSCQPEKAKAQLRGPFSGSPGAALLLVRRGLG
jgi:hypothetical protein